MAAASQEPSKLTAFADFARLVLEESDRAEFESAFAAAEAGSQAPEDVIVEWGPRAEARVWPAFLHLKQTVWAVTPEQPLRFGIGERVLANCGPPQAGGMGWQPGTVVGLWYRRARAPSRQPALRPSPQLITTTDRCHAARSDA